jgi:hypothetical protein
MLHVLEWNTLHCFRWPWDSLSQWALQLHSNHRKQ